MRAIRPIRVTRHRFFLDGRSLKRLFQTAVEISQTSRCLVQRVAVHWITISRIVLSWSCPQTPKPDEQDRSNHGLSL
jgi:hypothetical protein